MRSLSNIIQVMSLLCTKPALNGFLSHPSWKPSSYRNIQSSTWLGSSTSVTASLLFPIAPLHPDPGLEDPVSLGTPLAHFPLPLFLPWWPRTTGPSYSVLPILIYFSSQPLSLLGGLFINILLQSVSPCKQLSLRWHGLCFISHIYYIRSTWKMPNTQEWLNKYWLIE